MDQAIEGSYTHIDRLDMLEDIGKLEAELSRTYKSAFKRKIEDGIWDGFGLFMAYDARFKAGNPYLLIHFAMSREDLEHVLLSSVVSPKSFRYEVRIHGS
jgi:hypothetical protein